VFAPRYASADILLKKVTSRSFLAGSLANLRRLTTMTQHHALQMRLKIYVRREAYVWLSHRNSEKVKFGWILSVRPDDRVLFKDDDERGVTDIPVKEIESCGVV
jgi:hypothetical protein